MLYGWVSIALIVAAVIGASNGQISAPIVIALFVLAIYFAWKAWRAKRKAG